jgi:hypothetical protein
VGVEYRRWLAPKQGTSIPTAERFELLFHQLREGRWLPRRDSEATSLLEGVRIDSLGGSKLRKVPACRVHTKPARTVMRRMPFDVTREWILARGSHFSVGWDICADPTGDGEVGRLRYPLTALSDGSPNYYELIVFCQPKPETCPCDHDEWHYRIWLREMPDFGLLVDCSKDFARDAELIFRPEFHALAESALGVSLEELEEYY